MEDGGFVGLRVAIGVFEDEDAVALGAFAVVLAVVDDFAHPHATAVVDVDAGRRKHHRLAGEDLHGEFGMHVELLGGGFRLVRGGVVVAGGDGAWILGVNGEGDAGAALPRAAFIESAACFEALRARRQVKGDDAVRVRAEAVFDRFASAAQGLTFAVRVHAHIAPAGQRRFPFDLGEFFLAAISEDEPRLRPVRPIGGEAVSAIGDDEEHLLRAFERDIDVHAVIRRFDVDDRRAEERLRRGKSERGS